MAYFKKDEYIVITSGGDADFKNYNIFKQRIDAGHLSVYLSTKRVENGWMRYKKENPSNWRYATPEEIAAYDKHNAPCHIDEAIPVIPNYEIY